MQQTRTFAERVSSAHCVSLLTTPSFPPRRRGGHCKGRLSLSGAENCGWVFSPKTDEAKHWIASHIARPTSLLLLLQISISPFVFCHTQACLLPLIKVSILPRQKSNKYWVLVLTSKQAFLAICLWPVDCFERFAAFSSYFLFLRVSAFSSINYCLLLCFQLTFSLFFFLAFS